MRSLLRILFWWDADSAPAPAAAPVRVEFRLPVVRRREFAGATARRAALALPAVRRKGFGGAVARRILVTTPVVRRKEF